MLVGAADSGNHHDRRVGVHAVVRQTLLDLAGHALAHIEDRTLVRPGKRGPVNGSWQLTVADLSPIILFIKLILDAGHSMWLFATVGIGKTDGGAKS